MKSWQLSPAHLILTPGLNVGVNASDPDILEFKGKTYLYYSVGNQRTGSKARRSVVEHFSEVEASHCSEYGAPEESSIAPSAR